MWIRLGFGNEKHLMIMDGAALLQQVVIISATRHAMHTSQLKTEIVRTTIPLYFPHKIYFNVHQSLHGSPIKIPSCTPKIRQRREALVDSRRLSEFSTQQLANMRAPKG